MYSQFWATINNVSVNIYFMYMWTHFLWVCTHLFIEWIDNIIYVYSISVDNAKLFLRVMESFVVTPEETSCSYASAPMHSAVAHF